jgi:hypothetical protein
MTSPLASSIDAKKENNKMNTSPATSNQQEIDNLESELRSEEAKMTGGVTPTGAQGQNLMTKNDIKFIDEKKRIVTFSVLRCHGQIVSPLSIYFNNKALKVIKPLFENVRDFVPGGLPGQSVVSEGFCGIRSRMGGVQFAQKLSIEIAKQGMPACRPTITSGIVDIPTKSAPIIRRYLYSAGVSKHGPDTAT